MIKLASYFQQKINQKSLRKLKAVKQKDNSSCKNKTWCFYNCENRSLSDQKKEEELNDHQISDFNPRFQLYYRTKNQTLSSSFADNGTKLIIRFVAFKTSVFNHQPHIKYYSTSLNETSVQCVFTTDESIIYYSTKRRWLTTTTKKLATMLELIVAITEPFLCNDSAKY